MSAPDSIPPLVAKALKNGGELAFLRFTRNESGRLFAVLAAAAIGTIAEYGTGSGVGAAWLRFGAPQNHQVLTFEPDPVLFEKAKDTFTGDDITVINGGWGQAAAEGPYGLLHISLRNLEEISADEVSDVLLPQGVLVIDDFYPAKGWPPVTLNGVDYVRQSWLLDERFTAVDVAVTEDTSVIIAVKKA